MLATDEPVHFFDWKQLYAEHCARYDEIFRQTAAQGGFILQDAVGRFEQRLSAYLGVRHAVGVSDCTNAMLLGLRACGLEPGDEVILPGHAFIAAAQAIHFAGGKPVPVDLERGSWLPDPAAAEAAITPRTRAIMAVHVSGRTCDLRALRQIADARGLALYEDAAQALGARLDGQAAGTFGAWGAFSFYPSKTLGCFGDAGAIVTDDDALVQRLRAMRNHGAGPDKTIARDCAVWGTNSRIDNIHAAILDFKLSWYDEALARRRAIAGLYDEAFAELDWIERPPAPGADSRRFDIFQNYEVCCDERDALRDHLAARNIGTILHWGGTGINQFTQLGMEGFLPNTDRFLSRALLLPMNHLLRDDQVRRVIESVRSFRQ